MSATHTALISPALKAIANADRDNRLIRAVRAVWQALFTEPYRPERHYMRGPGPACARKQSELR
jgi:hypothetical protein